MKLVEMKCKSCGSILNVEDNTKKIKCKYCHSVYHLDDEVQHIKYDDMEQAGYDFEKGKIRAQQEAQNDNVNFKTTEAKKKNKKIWLILAWIFLLPFMATYYIIKSDKLDKKKKIIVLIVMWIVFFIIGVSSSATEQEELKNKVIECYSEETYEELNKIYGIQNINGLYTTSSCTTLKIKDENNKEIKISLNPEGKLEYIMVENKYLYTIDKSYDVYEKDLKTIKETADEDLKLEREKLERIFGDTPGKENYFFDNEKTIRRFVTEYNKINTNKVSEVDWEKNHTIAKLKFNGMSARVLSGTSFGFLIECEFGNGKSKIDDYKVLVKNMVKVLDNSIQDNDFDEAFNEANKNNLKDIKINDNTWININYNEDQVGYLVGDYYFIDVTVKNY